MLYAFYGDNTEGARDKARGLVDSLLAKRDGSLVFRVTPDLWSEQLLQEYLGGQGLFIQKYIVWLDGIFDDKDMRESAREFLPDMQSSQNIFIVLEKKFDAATLKDIKKYAEKTVEIEGASAAAGKSQRTSFSIFTLADAVGARDKKDAWMLYRQAIDLGMSPEEIVGTLFWQVKMILLAQVARSADEAGIKEFPFSKAKRYALNYSHEEAQALSSSLISLYHDAHRGEVNFEIGLEQLILEL